MSVQHRVLAVVVMAVTASAGCMTIDEKRIAEAPYVGQVARADVRQHIVTVASVDRDTQTVRLTNGSTLRLAPSTRMHVGQGGRAVAARDLRAGDRLIVVVKKDAYESRTRSLTGGPTSDASDFPSALPREAAGVPADPASGVGTSGQVIEVMVFPPAR